MKKIVISALCGLCLMAGFVCAPKADASTEVALSRKLIGIRS